MIFCSLRFALVLVGVVWSTLVLAHAQQSVPRRGRPIDFSDPRQDSASSNLNQMVTQKKTLQSLDDEFKKPFSIFDTGDPAANKITPPLRQLPPPNVNSKRLKELLDKRKDRGFETTEDLVTGLTAEEIFKVPESEADGEEKKKTTAMERYYHRLEREHLGNTNQMKGDELFSGQTQNDGRDGPASFGMERNPASTANTTMLDFKPFFGSESGNPLSPDMDKSKGLRNIFGFVNVESPQATRAHETRLQDFKQMLQGRSPPPAPGGPSVNPFNSATAPTPGLTPTRAFEPLPGAAASGSSSPLPTTPAGTPLGLPENTANRQSLSLPEPRRMPQPSPTFEIPRRKF